MFLNKEVSDIFGRLERLKRERDNLERLKRERDNLERDLYYKKMRKKFLEEIVSKDFEMRLKNVVSDSKANELVETTIVGYVDGKAVLGSIIQNNINRKTTSC